MTPTRLLASGLAALLLTTALATASADARARYRASVSVVATETFTYNPAGYPDRCASWVHATGTVRARAASSGPLIFARAGGFSGGGLSGDADGGTNVSREIDYTIHVGDPSSACTGCGPDSELGPCGDQTPKPDDVGSSRCPGSPTSDDAAVQMTIATTGTLEVRGHAPSRKVLLECSRVRPVPYGVPLGSPELELTTTRFPGAARRIAGLAKGRSTKFRKASTTGPTCKQKKAEMRACTEHVTVVKVERVE